MFAAKMVCLIQKLLGRDDIGSTDETSELSSLGVPCLEHGSQPEQTPRCGFRNYPTDCSGAERRDVGSNVPAVCRSNDGVSSYLSSQTALDRRSDGATCIQSEHGVFVEGDAHNSHARPSSYSSLQSSTFDSKSIVGEDCIRSSTPSFGAEPVCCCDSCISIIEAYNQRQLCSNSPRLVASTAAGFESMTSSSLCYDDQLSFVHSSSSFSGSDSFTDVGRRNDFTRRLSPESVSLHVASSSSSTKRPFCCDRTAHRADARRDVGNLPPMIHISADGEEGFKNSQRLLKQRRDFCKPFSEVPPNKTICHVHCKFLSGK